MTFSAKNDIMEEEAEILREEVIWKSESRKSRQPSPICK